MALVHDGLHASMQEELRSSLTYPCLQCAQISYLPGNGHAIFQVAFSNTSGHPKAPELPLLATRSDYLITVYRVESTQPYDNDGNLLEDQPVDWSLQLVTPFTACSLWHINSFGCILLAMMMAFCTTLQQCYVILDTRACL